MAGFKRGWRTLALAEIDSNHCAHVTVSCHRHRLMPYGSKAWIVPAPENAAKSIRGRQLRSDMFAGPRNVRQ
nr:hypothetical protein [uncultured Noviherbaspirillum sp.]